MASLIAQAVRFGTIKRLKALARTSLQTKFSTAYLIGMMDANNTYHTVFSEFIRKDEIVDEYCRLLDQPGNFEKIARASEIQKIMREVRREIERINKPVSVDDVRAALFP